MVEAGPTSYEEERGQLDALYRRVVEVRRHDVDAAESLAREYTRRAVAIGDPGEQARGFLLEAWFDELRGETAAMAVKVDRVMELAVAAGDEHSMVAALISQGVAERWRSDYAAAAERFTQAIELARRIGDRYNEIRALHVAADLAKLRNEFRRALEQYEHSLELARKHGFADLEAAVLSGLGNVYSHFSDYERAHGYHEQAVAVAGRCNDLNVSAVAWFGLGTVQARLGLYDEALEQYQRFLEHAERVRSPMRCAYAMGNIAMIMNARGRTPTAIRYEHECLKWKKQADDRAGIAISLNNLGMYHKAIGDYVRAFQASLQSMEICQQLGDREGEAVALDSIGTTYKVLGEHTRALDCYLRSLRIAQEVGNRSSEAHALVHIADYYEDLRDPGRALMYYMRALQIIESTNERYVLSEMLQRAAGPYIALGGFEYAESLLHRSIGIAREMGLCTVEIDSLISLADLEMRRAAPSAAIPHLESALVLADTSQLEVHRQNVLAELVRACEAAGLHDRRREYARSYSIGAGSAFYASEAHRVHELIDRFEENTIAREGALLGLGREEIDHIRELTRRRAEEPAHTMPEVGVVTAKKTEGTGEGAGEAGRVPALETPRVRVVTFGAMRVAIDGHTLNKRDWGRRRARDLFKLLLVHHRSWLTLDEIYDRIWGGEARPRPEMLIRNAVSHLRRALALGSPKYGAGFIHGGDGAYMLDLGEEAWVDFLVFKELIVLARRSENAAERARYYTEAVGLYQGEFLQEDQYHEWSGYERQVLRDAYLEGLEFLGRERLRRGELDEAIEMSRLILSRDSVSETAYEILLLALKRRGRFGEARQVLEQCVQAYREEIGTEPSPRLLALLAE